MKQQIDNLIANILLDEGELSLPEVGTLILRRQPAKLLSSKLLQRPYHELVVTSKQRSTPLTNHLVRLTAVSAERAEDIYAEWLAQSLRGGVLTINGVCTIEGGSVTTDKTFEDMANPQGRGSVKVNPRTNYFIYIIAGLCMGFAIGVAGYVLYTNGTIDTLLAKRNIAPASQAFETVAKVAPEVVVEPVAEEPTVTTEATTEEIATETVITPTEPTIASMRKGYSYAVWGVYNELQNAENAIKWLTTRIPEIEGAKIYDYDGRYMVALSEETSRSKCGHKVSAWKAQHKSCKSVWVYTR